MNSFDSWCRAVALTCCLILGIEGNLFVHNVATQARSLQAPMAVAEKHAPVSSKALARL